MGTYDVNMAQTEIELYAMDMLDMRADDYAEWVELMEREFGDSDED